jgi:hypothetical protein
MPNFEEFIGGEENADRFRATGDAVNRRAIAAMKAVFDRMPWGQVIELPGGEQASIEKFYEPKVDEEGCLRFGFDVRDTLGGWHLEFKVTKSGWGGIPIGEMKPIS